MNIKSLFAALLTGLLLVLAACSAEGGSGGNETGMEENPEDEMRTLEVDLQTPETASAEENVELTAHVHSNDEDVTDADQVQFEILQGEESLDMIEAEHSENGLYTIEYTFDEPGTYTVISHVDAFDLHTMPQKEITVE